MRALAKINLTVDGLYAGTVELPSLGEVNINLVRNGAGEVSVESTSVKENEQYAIARQDLESVLAKLHAALAATQSLAQHTQTDMFYFARFFE